jgi:hypothetical protein
MLPSMGGLTQHPRRSRTLLLLLLEPFAITKPTRFQGRRRDVTSQQVIGQFDREIATFLGIVPVDMCKNSRRKTFGQQSSTPRGQLAGNLVRHRDCRRLETDDRKESFANPFPLMRPGA